MYKVREKERLRGRKKEREERICEKERPMKIDLKFEVKKKIIEWMHEKFDLLTELKFSTKRNHIHDSPLFVMSLVYTDEANF